MPSGQSLNLRGVNLRDGIVGGRGVMDNECGTNLPALGRTRAARRWRRRTSPHGELVGAVNAAKQLRDFSASRGARVWLPQLQAQASATQIYVVGREPNIATASCVVIGLVVRHRPLGFVQYTFIEVILKSWRIRQFVWRFSWSRRWLWRGNSIRYQERGAPYNTEGAPDCHGNVR